MLLNTKCERCNEPTKHVVGFWDGENGKSGFVHDCENEKCEVRQLIKVTETKAMQERFRIQNLNSRKRMYAGYIAALRKDAKISMMEMSKIAGCSPAEYSAYEHERKPFDEETYRKCEEYLLKNEVKTDIHYPIPPHRQKAMQGILKGEYPISEEIHRTTLSLPISYGHSESDVYRVVEIMNKF